MSRAAALLSALILSSVAVYAAPVELRKPRVVIIFADVTSSLTIEQNRQVAEVTKDVLTNLPPLTAYRVYTIQADPDAKPIDFGTIRGAKGPKDKKVRDAEIMRAATANIRKIEQRYCEVNSSRGEGPCRNVPPRPQPDHRSCILEIVENVAGSFLSESNQRPIDLVFISDMVEDCDDTPLNRSIRLITDDLTADISNIDHFRDLEPLGPGVRITVVRPHVENGFVESYRRKHGLEAYWKKAFARFGADTTSWWWFNTSAPTRLVPDSKENGKPTDR